MWVNITNEPGDLYFEDVENKIFFINDIRIGAAILGQIPGRVTMLSVTFDKYKKGGRPDLTFNILQTCSHVKTLHLIGFMFEYFKYFKTNDLGQYLPNVKVFKLQDGDMPLRQLASMRSIEKLILWRLTWRFLEKDNFSISLPNMTSLEILLNIVPYGRPCTLFTYYISTFHFNIKTESVKRIRAAGNEWSSFSVKDLLSMSWENVERMEIDMHAQFSMQNIHKLLTNARTVREIVGIIIHDNVKPKEFAQVLCEKYTNLQSLQWSWKTDEQYRKLTGFIKVLETLVDPHRCGSISYIQNSNYKPKFTRVNHFQNANEKKLLN